MRLSTEPTRDEARALEVLRTALDAGVALLDTAGAYALDDAEVGHNERLLARAGAPGRVEIATKVGLTRPAGRWEPDGRARHLVAAAERSRAALGMPALDLLQLHAPDPRVPLATSVRALAGLLRDGVTRALGLCNVNLAQLEEARSITPVTTVQTRTSVLDEGMLRDGVVAFCLARGIRVLGYRPLGGARAAGRLARDPVLTEVAARHGATAAEVALAWLMDLGIVPLPGPTRVETARSCARAATLRLDEDDRARLDARIPGAAELRGRPRGPASPRVDGEIVLVLGMPAAGKSTLARALVERGHERLNRDLRGGTLDALAAELERRIAFGGRRFVLDNTYATRRSRAAVLEVAARHGLPVRCVWLTTGLEEAQVNACTRMLAAHGRLLGPEELKRAADPTCFAPSALFRYRREVEPPDLSEGFTAIDEVPFVRAPSIGGARRAVLVDLDAALWQSRAGARAPLDAADLEVPAARIARLRALHDEGWLLAGITWLPGVPDGAPLVARARELLGLELDVEVCPHPAGPPVCWCRKPLPGLALVLVARHGIDPGRSRFVGSSALDRTYAQRVGLEFVDRDEMYRLART